MQAKDVFRILGIEETKDADILKKAYREKLVHVNPEDDPEGFKRLREAYEEAVRLSEVEEGQRPETPVSQWVEKVGAVYGNLKSRIDILSWKALFEDSVCQDLDTADEAKEAFLVFLMDNYRLPVDVWAYFESVFHFVESKEDLYEKFPVEFINFLTDLPENKGWMDYTLFEGDPLADLDTYISGSTALRRMNDSEIYDNIESLFEDMKDIQMYHPIWDIEYMRYMIHLENMEEALRYADHLYSQGYADLYIKYYLAFAYYEGKQLERMREICLDILEECPDHFSAAFLMGSYYIDKGQYQDAKDAIIALLNLYPYDDRLMESLKKANEGLIEQQKIELEESPEDEDKRFALAWCYFQNDLYDECLELVKDMVIHDENVLTYHKLLGRVYMSMNNYEKAFPNLKCWLHELQKLENDDTEEAKEKREQFAMVYYFLANCHFTFSQGNEDAEEDKQKALEYIDLAIEKEREPNDRQIHLAQKARFLLKFNENEACIDVCDQIIKEDEACYVAYMYRQQAAYNLNMNQLVIDDYRRVVNLYAAYPNAYLLAIKTFMAFDMFDDVEGVISHSKENEVQSKEIEFQELVLERKKAENKEDAEAILSKMEAFYEETTEMESGYSDKEMILYEMACGYYDWEAFETALSLLERKLEAEPDADSLYLKGSCLFALDQFEEAIGIYKDYMDIYQRQGNAFYMLGLCYQNLNDNEESIAYYTKFLEIRPEDQFVNYRLMEVYLSSYTRTYNHNDFKKAVEHGEKQVEVSGTSSDYHKLGFTYMEGYVLEPAIKCFEKVIELDENSATAYYNLGKIYEMLDDNEAAYPYYQKSLELTGENFLKPYYGLANYYKKTKQPEKAVDMYYQLHNVRPLTEWDYKDIADIYSENSKWDEALEYRQKVRDIQENGEIDYLVQTGYIHMAQRDLERAFECVTQLDEKYPEASSGHNFIGDYYLFETDEKEKAIHHYEKAQSIAKKDENFLANNLHGLVYDILNAYHILGEEEKLQAYLKEIDNYVEGSHGGEEGYVKDPNSRKLDYYNLGLWSLYSGNIDKAKYYLERVKRTVNCAFCEKPVCIELYDLQGKIKEQEGQYAEALADYETGMNASPDRIEFVYRVNSIRKILGEQAQ